MPYFENRALPEKNVLNPNHTETTVLIVKTLEDESFKSDIFNFILLKNEFNLSTVCSNKKITSIPRT